MKCQKAEKLIDAYVSGALPDNDRRILEDHLRSCASCRAESAAAQGLELLGASMRVVDAPPLRDRIWDGMRDTGSSLLSKEKLMNTRKLTLSIGFVTAICAAALVGGLTLMPKSAMAVLKKSIAAVQNVKTAKVTIKWRDENGNHLRTVWSDQDRTRDDTDGRVMVYRYGQSSADPTKGFYIGRLEPKEWTLDHHLDIYNGVVPVDMGLKKVNGRQLRLVRIERDTVYGDHERWDYFLDDASNLPVLFVSYVKDKSGWVADSETTYEFNVPLDNQLFELPEGKTWHTLPNQDVEPARVLDMPRLNDKTLKSLRGSKTFDATETKSGGAASGKKDPEGKVTGKAGGN